MNEKVGYQNPPVSGQFKPGQSGNPAGRPRGSRSFKNIMQELAQQEVTLSFSYKDGEETIPYVQAIAKRLLHDAKNGESYAIKIVLPYLEQIKDEPAESEPTQASA